MSHIINNKSGFASLALLVILGIAVLTGGLFVAQKMGFNIIPDSATLTNDCISGPIIMDGNGNNLDFTCPTDVDYCKVTAEATWSKPFGNYGIVFKNIDCFGTTEGGYQYYRPWYYEYRCHIAVDFDGDSKLDVLEEKDSISSTRTILPPQQYNFRSPIAQNTPMSNLLLAKERSYFEIFQREDPGNMLYYRFQLFNGPAYIQQKLLNTPINESWRLTYGGNYKIGGYLNLCKSWDPNYEKCGTQSLLTNSKTFTDSATVEMQAGDSITFGPKNLAGEFPSHYQLRVLKYNDCTGSCSFGQTKCVISPPGGPYNTEKQCLDAGCLKEDCKKVYYTQHLYNKFWCRVPSQDLNSYYLSCNDKNDKGCNIYGTVLKCPEGQKCYSGGELKEGSGGCMCDPNGCVLGTTKAGSTPNRYLQCEAYGSCTRWSSEKSCDGLMVYDSEARGGKGDCVCPTPETLCESENQAWCENLQQIRKCTRNDWQAIDSTKTCIIKNDFLENQPDPLVECSQDGIYASWECIPQEGCTSTTSKRCNGNTFEICSCKEIPGSGTLCQGTSTEGCLQWKPVSAKQQCCVSDSDCVSGDPGLESSCNQVTHECKFERREGFCSVDSECSEYERCLNNVCTPKNTGLFCDATEVSHTRCDPNDPDLIHVQRCQKIINTNAYKWIDLTSCQSTLVNPNSYKCSYKSPSESGCACINEPTCTQGEYTCDGDSLKLCTRDSNGCAFLKDLGAKVKGCCISSKDECSAQEGYSVSCDTNTHECKYTPIADYCSTTNPCISPYVCDFSVHHCKLPPVNSVYCSASLSNTTSCRTEPNYQYVCEFNPDLTHGEMGDIYTWEKTECLYPQQCFNNKCTCPMTSDFCKRGSAPVCTSDERSKKECINSVGACYKWEVIPCIGDQKCKDGVCVCPSEEDDPKYCDEAGSDKCSDDLHSTLVCQNVNGCLQWVTQETCGKEQLCVKHSPAKCTYPIDDIVVITKPAYAVGEPIRNVSIIATSQQFKGQTLFLSGVLSGDSEIRKDTFTNIDGKGNLDFGNSSGIMKVGTFPLLIQVCNQAPTYDHTEICKKKNVNITVKKTLEIRLNSPFSTIKGRVCSVSYQVVDKANPTLIVGVTPTISVMQGSTEIPYTIEGTNTIKFTPIQVGNVIVKLGATKIDYISDSHDVTIEVKNPTRTSSVKIDNQEIFKVTGLLPVGKHTITLKVDKSGEILELYPPQLKMETPTGQVLDLDWTEMSDKGWKTDYNFIDPGKTYVLSGAITFKDLSEASESVSYTIATKGVQTGGQKTSGTWATMGLIVLGSFVLLITTIIVLMRRRK